MIAAPRNDSADFELMLARAFDLAWDEFVRIEGDAGNTPENRGSLAARIVVLARSGEPDERKIGAASLVYLRALAAAKRIVRDDRSNLARVTLSPRPNLDQAGIDAAASALDACLDDLPEGLSGAARSVLSQAILEEAGKGCRDAKELKRLALLALKARL